MAIFPHASRMFHGEDVSIGVAKLAKMLRVSFILLLVVAVIFTCSPRLVVWFLPELNYNVAKYLVWLMAPALLFGCMNYIIGVVGLINLKASNLFERNIWVTGFVSVALMFLFCKDYSYYTAAAVWSISEILLFALCLWSLHVVKQKKSII